jgi:hypothetical protein
MATCRGGALPWVPFGTARPITGLCKSGGYFLVITLLMTGFAAAASELASL